MRTPTVPVVVCIGLALAGCGRSAVPESAPVTSESTATASAAADVTPDRRVGAIFLGGTDTHVCSASVLHSTTGDLVLTAAHCLADGVDTEFVPAFAGDATARWQVNTVYLDQRWVTGQDPRADFAIVRVHRDGAPPVESLAGGLVLGSAPAPGTAVTVTGYPIGDGGTPVRCEGRTSDTRTGFPSLRCAGLVDGTSGAPWVSGAAVTGVTGGYDSGGCDDDVSYSAPFGDAVSALLARAQADGPGDAAPEAFLADC